MDLVLRRWVTRSARPVQPRILWKNLNGEKAETFKALVLERVEAGVETATHGEADQMWNSLASIIRDVAKEALGVAEGTREDRTREVERYKEAKREAKKAVARAKDKAYEDLYRKLDSKEGANDIYKIAKAREHRRRDIDIIKFIKDEAGQTLVKEEEIRKRWEGYFSSLFVGGGPGRQDDSRDGGIGKFQNNNLCRRISHEEVRMALLNMGRNKAVGLDQIPIEAWQCLGEDGVRWLACLFNKMFRIYKMPTEWRRSEIIPIFKNKGDAQIYGSYRGIKLLSHTMKLWERVIETRLCRETTV
ncbi:uncharacterized protein [Rutidosis leptorrhynchoides]|uniref:uncharacterized protein n=1 Tax=Rutidosis leptorrhynchoides TaxID=125765 RepID=UPI003A9A096B